MIYINVNSHIENVLDTITVKTRDSSECPYHKMFRLLNTQVKDTILLEKETMMLIFDKPTTPRRQVKTIFMHILKHNQQPTFVASSLR